MSVYVSKNGEVTLAVGAQPRDALLFAPSKKSFAEAAAEQREAWRRSNRLIQERFAEATRR